MRAAGIDSSLGYISPIDLRSRAKFVFGLLASLLAAASMWFYVGQILVGYQVKDAAKHDRPRGNLSDLYPRWLGARELLLHHRNPYGDDVTLEIQQGYYGRALDPSRPNDPRDQQGFAYPVYVVFELAPLIGLPFQLVHTFFYWLLALLTAASVPLWLRVLGWKPTLMGTAMCLALTLGSFPVVQGIRLQQLTLLVAALLAGAVACIASEYLFLGGALLALATIKPQLAWLFVAWLLLWVVSDWRARRNFIYGFGLVMALLLIGSKIVLPGWIHIFIHAVGQYHGYTQNQSVIEVALHQILTPFAGSNLVHGLAQLLAVVAVIGCAPILWKLRTHNARTSEFGHAAALVLALTVLIVPMYAPYNQVLLLPAILLLVRDQAAFVAQKRLAYWIGGAIVLWQWLASLALCLIYILISRERALNGWAWPLFATFALPIWIFALMLVASRMKPPADAIPHGS
jgi:Glycosyltransferase family 87